MKKRNKRSFSGMMIATSTWLLLSATISLAAPPDLAAAHETRGTMLHTPLADQQGQGRLSRAGYFYRYCQQQAAKFETPFNWQFEIAPGVGPESHKMSKAAARYLYAGE